MKKKTTLLEGLQVTESEILKEFDTWYRSTSLLESGDIADEDFIIDSEQINDIVTVITSEDFVTAYTDDKNHIVTLIGNVLADHDMKSAWQEVAHWLDQYDINDVVSNTEAWIESDDSGQLYNSLIDLESYADLVERCVSVQTDDMADGAEQLATLIGDDDMFQLIVDLMGRGQEEVEQFFLTYTPQISSEHADALIHILGEVQAGSITTQEQFDEFLVNNAETAELIRSLTADDISELQDGLKAFEENGQEITNEARNVAFNALSESIGSGLELLESRKRITSRQTVKKTS